MKKIKRGVALTAVILWGVLIIVTLFKGLIFTDIVFPIVIYAMMLVYRYLSKR